MNQDKAKERCKGKRRRMSWRRRRAGAGAEAGGVVGAETYLGRLNQSISKAISWPYKEWAQYVEYPVLTHRVSTVIQHSTSGP